MTIRTLGLASGVTSLQDHRLALGAFMGPGASVLERRGGICYYPGAADLVSASALQANVTPFVAIVDGTSNALQGQITVVVDANETLTFSAGEAAVARTDRVILQIRDTAYDGSGSTDARVLVVQGNTSTGAATAVPASSLLLWEVVVPIGASSITFSSARVDKRQWTSTPMRIPVTGSTQRDALPAIPGLEVTRLDTGDIQQYWSGAWRTVGPAATPTRFLVNNQAERDALPATTGLEVTRLDTGEVQQYWSGAWRTIAPASSSSQVLFVRKPSNTSRSSTTSFSDDPHLSLPVAANSTYVVDAFIIYDAPSASDLQAGFTCPAGSDLGLLYQGPNASTADAANFGTLLFAYSNNGSNVSLLPFGGVGTNPVVLHAFGSLVTSATAGSFTLTWTQNTAGAATTVRARSHIRLEKVA